VISSLGWATAPLVIRSTGVDIEGALIVATLAGIASTALTGPATLIVLSTLGVMPRLGFWRYAGVVLVISLPALTFESYAVSASVMPVILGNWALESSLNHIWFAAAFIALYSAFIGVTYLGSRRGGLRPSR
jgi:hypothetical protein